MSRKDKEFDGIDRRDVLKGLGASTVGLGAGAGLASAHHPEDVQIDNCPETVGWGERCSFAT